MTIALLLVIPPSTLLSVFAPHLIRSSKTFGSEKKGADVCVLVSQLPLSTAILSIPQFNKLTASKPTLRAGNANKGSIGKKKNRILTSDRVRTRGGGGGRQRGRGWEVRSSRSVPTTHTHTKRPSPFLPHRMHILLPFAFAFAPFSLSFTSHLFHRYRAWLL